MTEMYHYTTVDGFHGIISNRSIRMTKSNYLNDPSDCFLFVTLVKEYLEAHPEVFENSLSKLKVNNDLERGAVRALYAGKCDLIGYMKYIHGHISLYVLSLSGESDDMRMWKYYGRGGMQLAFSVEDLTKSLVENFISGSQDEYLVDQNVIYVDPKKGIEGISTDVFAKFRMFQSSTDMTVFQENQLYLQQNHNQNDYLYDTSNIESFIAIYMDSYLNTLYYLLHTSNGMIASDKSNEIYQRVYRNVSSLDRNYLWKHDISLYMIMLSILIKNNAYQHEKERRLVYFKYSDSRENKREKYLVKRIEPGDFIQPYALFKREDEENFLRDSLKGVRISPITKKTMPIDHNEYKETLRDYLYNNRFDPNINIEYSEHDYRW